MAQGDIVTTVIGNLADDPELRFTPGGDAVCKFRVASTPRIFDKASNEWKDGTTSWVSVTCWRKLAENVAATLKKGSRVVAYGTFRERSWEVEVDGVKQNRHAWELTADEVGAALAYATAAITRNEKSGGQGARGDEVWAGASKTPPAQPAATTGQPPAGPSAESQRTAQAAAPAGAEPPPW